LLIQLEGDLAVFGTFAHGDLAVLALTQIARQRGGLGFFGGPDGANHFIGFIVFEKYH